MSTKWFIAILHDGLYHLTKFENQAFFKQNSNMFEASRNRSLTTVYYFLNILRLN